MNLKDLDIIEVEKPIEFKLNFEEMKIINNLLPKSYVLINPQKNLKNKLNNIKGNKNKNFLINSKKSIDIKFKKPTLNNMQTRCLRVLNSVKAHSLSYSFLKPVDPYLLKIPDYFDYIKEPMDLSTVEKKIKNGEYFSSSQFRLDMNKIWNNAMIYNTPETYIYKYALEIRDYFKKLFEEEFYIEFKEYNKISKKTNNLYEKLRSFDNLFSKNYEDNFPTNDDYQLILTRLNYLNQKEFNTLVNQTNLELKSNNLNLKELNIDKLKDIYNHLHNKRFLIHSRIKKNKKWKLEKDNDNSDSSLILDFDEID